MLNLRKVEEGYRKFSSTSDMRSDFLSLRRRQCLPLQKNFVEHSPN
jgi:hypothetical protein